MAEVSQQAIWDAIEDRRWLVTKHLGKDDVDEHLHDIFLKAHSAAPALRDEAALVSFVHTITVRHIFYVIKERRLQRRMIVACDVSKLSGRQCAVEEAILGNLILNEALRIISSAMSELPERSESVVRRFYFADGSKDDICSDMRLSGTQFRLIKSIAVGNLRDHLMKQYRRGDLMLLLRRS